MAVGAPMEILIQFLVILLAARAFGEISVRLGQSPSVGELLAGVAVAAVAGWLGVHAPVLGGLVASPALGYAAQAGVFFLVLQAAVEMRPVEIAQATKGAVAIALGGVMVPLAGGVGLGLLFLPETPQAQTLALVIGVSMAITAIPTTVKVFSELGLLHTKVGELVVSAAIIDDVIGLILLAAVIALVQTGQLPDLGALAWMLAKVAAFFAITILLGVQLYPRISRRIQEMQAATLELSAMVMAGLVYGCLAEILGLHWILGAFMAGLYFEESRVGALAYEDLRLILTALTNALLGPLFFAWIGLQVNLGAVGVAPVFLLALILVAFAGKALGAGLPARAVGRSWREAAMVGVGMSGRGAMELVVLSVVLEAGLFGSSSGDDSVTGQLFSLLVIMAMTNTLMMPMILTWLNRPQGCAAKPPG